MCGAVYLPGMGHKLVAHFRKIKTAAGLSAVAHHNARLGVYDKDGKALGELPDYIIKPENAKRWNEGGGVTAEAIHELRRRIINGAELARKPQKNAASAVEFTFTASPGWFEGKERTAASKLLDSARRWAVDRFGADNVLHVAMHFDEKTPHMHMLLLPIIRDAEKGARYSSGDFLGGRAGLRAIQTDLAEVMVAYGLERGVEGSESRHNDQTGWAKKLAQKEVELKAKEATLKAKETTLGRQEIKLSAKEIALHQVELKHEVEMKNLYELRQEVKANLETVTSTDFGKWVHKNLEYIPIKRRPEVWQAAAEKAAEIRAQEQAKERQTKQQDKDFSR